VTETIRSRTRDRKEDETEPPCFEILQHNCRGPGISRVGEGDAVNTVRGVQGFPFCKTGEGRRNKRVFYVDNLFVHIRAQTCSLCIRNVSARCLHHLLLPATRGSLCGRSRCLLACSGVNPPSSPMQSTFILIDSFMFSNLGTSRTSSGKAY